MTAYQKEESTATDRQFLENQMVEDFEIDADNSTPIFFHILDDDE